jgi:hypothetical protein
LPSTVTVTPGKTYQLNELQNNAKAVLAVAPVTLGATGNNAGRIIDRKGYAGVEFIVEYGAITTTGTNVAVTMKEGDATGSMASVADADMIGTEALAGLLAGSTARASGVGKLVSKRVGYKGNKRYVSIDLNGTGTTSAGIVAASALLFNPEVAPVSNP